MAFVQEVLISKWFGYPLILGLLFGSYVQFGVIKVILLTAIVAGAISIVATLYQRWYRLKIQERS